jgi:excisionase family DNA binding protein
MGQHYLTIPEVAARMRCDHRVVRKAIHRGELEAAKIGERWLIREEAVDAWFEARTARRAAPVRQRAAPRARPTTEGQRSVARLREMERMAGKPLADEPLGEITAEQIEAARRDPRVIGLHAKADQHLAELRKTRK